MSIVNALANDPRIVVTRPWRTVKRLLGNPDTFFEEKAGTADGLRAESLLFLVGAAAVFVALAYVTDTIIAAFAGTTTIGGVGAGGPTIPPDVKIRLWGRAFRAAGGLIAAWLVYSAVVVALTWVIGGYGSVARVMKVAAWALLPVVAAHVLYYGALALAFTLVEPRAELRGGTIGAQAQYLVNAGANEVYVLAAHGILVLSILLSGYLLVYAVKHSRHVATRSALWVAAVPTLVHAALAVWAVLQRTTMFNAA